MEEVVESLTNAPSEIACPETAVLKVILVRRRHETRWSVAVAALRIGDDPHDTIASDHETETLRRISVPVPWENLNTVDFLNEGLSGWRSELQIAGSSPSFSGGELYHRWSSSEYSQWPSWFVALNSPGYGRESFDTADSRGPFFDAKSGWAAASLSEVVLDWVGFPVANIEQQSVATYGILLPDRRAALSHLSMSGTTLSVNIEGRRASDLFVVARGDDHDGHRMAPPPVAVASRLAKVEFPRSVRSLHVGLWSASSELLDLYDENENWTSRKTSVLRAPPRPNSVEGLTAALEEGESQQVEFKEWVPVSRSHEKHHELLETVVAFGNAHGGSILIGVSDAGIVTGIEKQLYEEMSKKHPHNTDARRDAYVGELKKSVAENLEPSLPIRFNWLQSVDGWVLRIDVDSTAEPLCFLQNRNDCFIRRGATNRKMSRAEVISALRRRDT